MGTHFKAWAAVLAAVGSAGGVGAQFTPGNLVVLRVGDGSTALGTSSTAVFLDQFARTGANQTAGFTAALPTTGAAVLTLSGTGTSEGLITRSADNTRIVVAGYGVGPGRANVATAVDLLRVTDGVIADGTAARIGGTFLYDGAVHGAASANGSSAYMVGAITGTVVTPSGNTVVSNTITNQRAVNIFNGNLYTSTASGTAGVYQVGTGLPTASGTASNLVVPTGPGSSPFAFALNDAVTVAYIADDRATGAGGGIQKWTGSGTTWTLAGTFTNLSGTAGARGLAVDFSGVNPTLFATTTDGRLVTVTDTGANFGDAAITLATAGPNTAFRGVTFSPVPEPATVGLIGAAVLCAGASVRRRWRREPAVA